MRDDILFAITVFSLFEEICMDVILWLMRIWVKVMLIMYALMILELLVDYQVDTDSILGLVQNIKSFIRVSIG